MRKLVKKILAVTLICIMQVGMGASISEASTRHSDKHHHEQRYENHHKDRDQRLKEERERHEREMQRHDYESDWEYHERQQREKEHHEEVMRTIVGGLALLAIILDND